MSVNYQIIVDLIANMGLIVFPIATLFCICEKLVDVFLGFVGGSRRVKIC